MVSFILPIEDLSGIVDATVEPGVPREESPSLRHKERRSPTLCRCFFRGDNIDDNWKICGGGNLDLRREESTFCALRILDRAGGRWCVAGWRLCAKSTASTKVGEAETRGHESACGATCLCGERERERARERQGEGERASEREIGGVGGCCQECVAG